MSVSRVDLEDVKARVDLVALVSSRGVELRRSGAQFVGLCPLHDEKTPSFCVHPEHGFYCHGCGANGDAIEFLMLADKLPFEEALAALTAFAGAGLATTRRAPRATEPSTPPTRDAGALWNRLALRDEFGERYLAGRGILPSPIQADVLRFNVPGCTGDFWLEARARESFRVAFAVRDVAGRAQTISLRRVSEQEPKKLSLAGCSVKGGAICTPDVKLLSSGDPEFQRDEVLLLEGGTSMLGASLYFTQAVADEEIAPLWILGVIGASNAGGVVEAFASVLRWRTVLLGFDADAAGEAACNAAADAARHVGARNVFRMKPPGGAKDWADIASREHGS